MKEYKHVFFDLDNTLWDFTNNSKDSLKEVFDKYKFDTCFSSFHDFYEIFQNTNHRLWEEYRKRIISKEALTSRRFQFAVDAKNLQDGTAIQINSEYLAIISQKTKIIENAFTVLNHLKNKYFLHIITDGFFEVQVVKLRNSKLSGFFHEVITAEEIGYLKPSVQLFQFALEVTNATKEESIMVGDSYENDIVGAHNAGIDQIFFNPTRITNTEIQPTYTVHSLKEIMNIL